MLSKCANPTCTNLFRYLHEGRLYLVNSASHFDGRKRFSTPDIKSGSPEFDWLCSVCSSYMTIHIDEGNGTIVVVESETLKCHELHNDP